MSAPVQVLVVGLDRPDFTGEVMAELRRLDTAGIVRLLDLLVVSRSTEGSFETIESPAAGADGRVAAALLGCDSGAGGPAEANAVSEPGTWSLADAVAPGTTAAVALIEHLWAAPLAAAIHRAGGTPLDETWLAPADIARLGALLATSS